MLTTLTSERIDAHWATHLGCSLTDLRGARVIVVAHGDRLAGYRGVYALRTIGGGLVISTPPEHRLKFDAALSRETPDAAFDAQRIANVLGAIAGAVVGPASLAYVDPPSFRPVAGSPGAARALGDRDHSAFAALCDACDPVEWQHGDVDMARNRVCGVFADDTLIAVASWEARGAVCNVGVVTHPAHRGRGHGSAAASAVTAHLLDQGELPQWQTLLDNAPSLNIGRALGYVERYRSIAVRLA